MDEYCLTKPHLESLTTRELMKLADTLGLDVPPGVERIFIIEELLDAAETEDEIPSPPITEVRRLVSAPLPKQYNITFIEVMLRDPLWAFVFWEVKAHDKERYEGAADFSGYGLRAYPLGLSGHEAEQMSFTVPVGNDDTAWYLGFPPSAGNDSVGGRFKADLCVFRGEESIVLASSHPFRLPKLLNQKMDKVSGNPLILLSGVEDFAVLRSADRLSRVPRYCNG